MKFLSLLFMFAFLAIEFTNSESPLQARLLVEKQVLNKFLVEQKDILINYKIFNVGESAAVNVKVNDATLPLYQFDIVSGSLNFDIPKIAPASSATHSVVIRTHEGIIGRFNFTGAQITYGSQDSSEIVTVFSSEPGEGYIFPLKEFNKRFSPHYFDWFVFIALASSSIIFPYFIWNGSKSKYEAISAKKSK